MKKPKKFRRGSKPIPSMEKLCKELRARNWVFLHSKPKHPSVMISMTYRTLNSLVEGKALRRAIPTVEVKP